MVECNSSVNGAGSHRELVEKRVIPLSIDEHLRVLPVNAYQHRILSLRAVEFEK